MTAWCSTGPRLRPRPDTLSIAGYDLSFLEQLQERSFAAATSATRASYPPERRMSASDLAHYLARRRYLVIATVRKDGRPHAALSAFVFSGKSFWLPTMSGTARERNVRTTGFVSLVVAEGDGADHKAVLSEGPAEVLPGLEGSAAAAWSERHGDRPAWATAWIKVEPTKVFSYDAGAPEHVLVGWTCEACGDTFTTHSGEAPRCPSCGGGSARVAAEPFL